MNLSDKKHSGKESDFRPFFDRRLSKEVRFWEERRPKYIVRLKRNRPTMLMAGRFYIGVGRLIIFH